MSAIPNHKSAKEIIQLFKTVLNEAAKYYEKPAYEVCQEEFSFISGGRITKGTFRRIAKYATIRSYLAPSPKSSLKDEGLMVLKRILKNAK